MGVERYLAVGFGRLHRYDEGCHYPVLESCGDVLVAVGFGAFHLNASAGTGYVVGVHFGLFAKKQGGEFYSVGSGELMKKANRDVRCAALIEGEGFGTDSTLNSHLFNCKIDGVAQAAQSFCHLFYMVHNVMSPIFLFRKVKQTFYIKVDGLF